MKKIFTIKDRSFLIFLIFLCLLATIIFFYFNCYFPSDGSGYYYLSLMFDGTVDFSNWWAVRGFVYPLYLFIITFVFGRTIFGVTTSLFISYFAMLCITYFFCKRCIDKNSFEENKYKIVLTLFILIVINPIILGYSHCVLTESLSVLLAFLSVYLSIQWYNQENMENIKNFIIYICLYSAIFVISWFLKQSYLIIVIIAMGFSLLFTLIKKFNKKIILMKFCTVFIAFLFLSISMKAWNAILVKYNLKDVNQTYISNSLISALRGYYYPITDSEKCNIEFVKTLNVSNMDEKELTNRISNNKCGSFTIFRVSNLNYNEIGYKVIFYDEMLTMSDSIKFVFNEMVDNPKLVIASYYNNYMATINLHEYFVDNGVYYSGNIFKSIENENLSLALHPLKSGNSYWWWFYLNDHTYEEYKQNYPYAEYMEQFEQNKGYNERVNNFIDFIYPVYSFLFKFLFLISPFLMLWHFIMFLKFENKKDMILTTIYGTAFFYILFYAVTGATIDRYAFTYYPLLLTVLIIEKFEINSYIKRRSESSEKRNKKNKDIIRNASI